MYKYFLLQCDVDAEGKYLHPHDLIYAQPVAIKPVGRPIPAVPVPVKGPGYGPPRPVPLPPSRPGYGPPPLPPSRPYYPTKKGPIPVYEPDDIHSYKPILEEKKPVVVVNGQGSGVQTHVHHHYHHGDKVSAPGVIDTTFDPAPFPSASGSYGTPSFSTGPLYGNSIAPSGSGGLYSGSSSYGGKPDFYKKQLNLKGSYSGKQIFCLVLRFKWLVS